MQAKQFACSPSSLPNSLWAVEDLPTNNFPDGKFSQAASHDFCLCYAKQKYRCDLRVLTQAKQFACSPSSLPNSLWAVEDSNLRPFARQANALPTELTARIEFLDTTLKKEKSKDFLPSRFPSSEQVVRSCEIQKTDNNKDHFVCGDGHPYIFTEKTRKTEIEARNNAH